MNNWQRIGIEKKEDVLKYLLAKLYMKRKQILDSGLGGAWTGAQGTKHPQIPEFYEATFIIGNKVFMLTEKGFENAEERG